MVTGMYVNVNYYGKKERMKHLVSIKKDNAKLNE